MAEKTIVLIMFDKNESVESISVGLFDKNGPYYSDIHNAVVSYRGNINALELKDDKWVYASIIGENEKIILKKPFEINIKHFDIINILDDKSLQRIFREVSTINLSIALQGVSEETKEKVFRNVSKRIGVIIKEDIESIENINDKDIKIARKHIIEIIKRLYKSGEIVITGGMNNL
jgi:hypothetical protein